jgi:hypothetical protein
VFLPGVEEELGRVGRVDEVLGSRSVLGELRIVFLGVDLDRDAGRPGGSELRHRQTRVHQQRPASGWARLGQLLRRDDAEGEPGVDGIGPDLLGRRDSASGELGESLFPREGHALVDRVESAPLEHVGRVDDVPGLSKPVGERAHPVGQAQHMVVEHYFGHNSLLHY